MYSPQLFEMITPGIQEDRVADAERRRQAHERCAVKTRLVDALHGRLSRATVVTALRVWPARAPAHAE